jgi:hypothetical protein
VVFQLLHPTADNDYGIPQIPGTWSDGHVAEDKSVYHITDFWWKREKRGMCVAFDTAWREVSVHDSEQPLRAHDTYSILRPRLERVTTLSSLPKSLTGARVFSALRVVFSSGTSAATVYRERTLYQWLMLVI